MAWSALLLLLLLLWDQEQLFAPGFQLSYLAVSFLLLVYPKLESLLKKNWDHQIIRRIYFAG